jgi:plasmid stabilization system protein ParE
MRAGLGKKCAIVLSVSGEPAAVYRNARRAVVRRFPYLPYFSVSDDTIIVLACLHSKRDSVLLRSRIASPRRSS